MTEEHELPDKIDVLTLEGIYKEARFHPAQRAAKIWRRLGDQAARLRPWHRHYYRPIATHTRKAHGGPFTVSTDETILVYACYCCRRDQHTWVIIPGAFTLDDLTGPGGQTPWLNYTRAREQDAKVQPWEPDVDPATTPHP